MDDQTRIQEIAVTDVKMRFGSMVVFMVKWAIASVPALIILVVIGVACASIAAGVVGGCGATMMSSKTERSAPSSSTPSTEATQAATDYVPKVLVRNVSVGETALDEAGVWGEVRNEGDKTLDEVEIVIYCLGSDGKPVFEKRYSPVLVTTVSLPFSSDSNEPLKPGYSRKFGVKLDDAPSDWTKKVRVEVVTVRFQEG